MKMRVITITESNIKTIYGRLRKFFYNNNHTGFEEWHNFDCGFKKHISPIIYIGKDKIRNVNEYSSPDAVEFIKDGTRGSSIILRLTATNGDRLKCGDKIAFCGNRIIYRTKCFFGCYKYIYTVFQVLPMTLQDQYDKRIRAERGAANYQDDYY